MLHAKMLLAQALPALAPAPQDLLLAWRQHIKHKFPSVEHLSCQILQAMMDENSCVPLLLDFRSESEHACSHICASVRVDPDAAPADILSLMRQHSVFPPPTCSSGSDGSVSRRVAVFYCSIGYRSSAAAARVLESEVIACVPAA
jgi:rhodanese-related sulfurtransferase